MSKAQDGDEVLAAGETVDEGSENAFPNTFLVRAAGDGLHALRNANRSGH